MGFLGRISGWDQQKDAHNAIAAHHLALQASAELKESIAERLVLIQRHGHRSHAEPPAIFAHLNEQPRIVQMNFVALACNSMGIPPMLRGITFTDVSNPYLADDSSSRARLSVACGDLSRRTGVALRWPGDDAKENFVAWAGRPAPASPTSVSQSIAASRDVGVAVDLADALLGEAIDRNRLAAVAEGLAAHWAGCSDHHLALVTAQFVFERPELVPHMFDMQVAARAQAVEWFLAREISADALRHFEATLYDLYRS